MVIELLPALIAAIRAAAMANDNSSALEERQSVEPPPPEGPEPPAGPPLVRALRRRPGVTYARSANVILPLVFAERMPGWQAPQSSTRA